MIELRRQGILRSLAAYGDRHVAPECTLLRLPVGAPSSGWQHPSADSLLYALVLLEMADRSRQGLAEQIVIRLLKLQRPATPARRDSGFWPASLEAATSRATRASHETAAIALFLGILRRRHHRRLSRNLGAEIDLALGQAASALHRNAPTRQHLAAACVLLHEADRKPEPDSADSALSLLERRAAVQPTPPALSCWLDDALAFAALREQAESWTRLPRLSAVVERLDTRLSAESRLLLFPNATTSPDLHALLELVQERSGRAPVPQELPIFTDFRAALACVLRPWFPTSTATVEARASVAVA